ncbi:NAD(P)-binding protein, partial [Eremomyces bilateralis CBS 781.70]
SGNLGSPVVTALVDEGFQVSVTTRKSSSATFPTTVTAYRTDYSSDELRNIVNGHDAIVVTLGFEGFDIQIGLIEIAIAAGVKRFIPGEFGSDRTRPQGRRLKEFDAVLAPKQLVLERLQAAAQEQKLEWTGIATGPFFDWAIDGPFNSFGMDLSNSRATIFGSGNEQVTATNLGTIALAVAKVLQLPEKTKNRMLRIRSVQSSQNEVLAELEVATGTSWTVDRVETEGLVARGFEKLSKGDRFGFLDVLAVELFEDGAGRSVVVSEEDADNALLGIPFDTVKGTVERLVKQRAS